MNNNEEIVLYQPNSAINIEVRLLDETIWLTQQQIAELFGVQRPAITKHLNNIFKTRELDEFSVSSILEHTAQDGKIYATKFYNLDAILSVGYRVNSKNATLFRQWANTVLKDYLLKGYAINKRLENIENRVAKTEKQIEFFVRTSLPPKEGIFYDGQIFDAYVFVTDLIQQTKKSIILIDNYINADVLLMLSKRKKQVSATVYTDKITRQLQLDIDKYNQQYEPINVKTYTKSHDRFLLIDNNVYHIGASVKDLGKKLFAFSKMQITSKEILKNI